ncbi:hypothetical protein G9444_6229 [Rhodococcus erythropolis]|uniref:Uncharacterized protein n=2 Tax=Nocardiaceae TaxID=85025 RepID=A0A6G9D304_RHOER|nr:hypothetical protein [Rhodococcus erythropolis]QIP43472.1 hypothetical protein G9444_6229 [Rhodococcus erythropolis]
MAIAAIIAVAALLIWGFGSIIARLAGAIAVFEGLLRIGFTGSTPTAYAILTAGPRNLDDRTLDLGVQTQSLAHPTGADRLQPPRNPPPRADPHQPHHQTGAAHRCMAEQSHGDEPMSEQTQTTLKGAINQIAPVIDLGELLGRQRTLNTPTNVADAQTSFTAHLVEDVMGGALTGEENRILLTGIESTHSKSPRP